MSKSCYRLLIIGAGQFGSRHLQGLALINLDVEIIVVDPDPNSLELAQFRFKEMNSNSHIHSLDYHQNISRLFGEIDLAIIATTADIRRQIIENLLGVVKINYLILEKVAFQSIADFEFVMRILDNDNVKTWVNCPRRLIPFFRNLREDSIQEESIRITVNGSNFGLASNSIHMLDLFLFLTGQKELSINVKNLDKKIYESKRPKFVEFAGRLIAQTLRGDTLEIIDDKTADNYSSSLMYCEIGKQKIKINQLEGYCIISNKNNSKDSIKMPFQMPLQSELTGKQAEYILKTGTSCLTSLEESYLLHKPMLNAFNTHISSILKKPVTVCPIT